MNKEKRIIFFVINIVLFVLLLHINNLFIKLKSEFDSANDQINELNYIIDDYKYALDSANDNILELNDVIYEAQGYAWSSYEDMGYVLDNMYTLDEIDNP